MKIVLQKDVKNVGKVGDIVNVAIGYARNFLFPRKLAVIAIEKNVKAWEHVKQVAAQKKKKALAERKTLLEKISGVTLTFKMASSDKEKIFGSVTAHDISIELEKKGFSVDRRDLQMEPIKILGQHKVKISYGPEMTAEITVVVEKE